MKWLISLYKSKPEIITLFLTISVLLLTLFISKTLDLIDLRKEWKWLLLACLVVFIFFIAQIIILKNEFNNNLNSVIALSQTKITQIERKFEKSLSRFEELKNSLINKPQWIVSEAELNIFEREFGAANQGKQIWIITSSLKNDIDGGGFEDVLESNMTKHNIIYKYVLMVSGIDAERRRELFTEKFANLKVYELLPEQFFSVTLADLAIYNPKGNERERKGFLELPNSNGENYWVEIPSNTLSHFLEHIKKQVPGIW